MDNTEYFRSLSEILKLFSIIRLEIRPLINRDKSTTIDLNKSKEFIYQQIGKLKELCRSVLIDNDHSLYDKICDFTNKFENVLMDYSLEPEEFSDLWIRNFQKEYDEVQNIIRKIVWESS
jgi:hypothetical protein